MHVNVCVFDDVQYILILVGVPFNTCHTNYDWYF